MAAEKQGIEPLDVDNYATWRVRMKCILITKGLWSAIECDENATPDASVDKKALAQMGLYVKEHHLTVLDRCKTAKEAWELLEKTYQAKSNARKRQLRKALTTLKMGASEPLTKYVARAKEIQDQLRAAGHEVSDQEVAWSLLAGLPSQYDTVVTVLETGSDSDVSLDDILPKLMPVEQQLVERKMGEMALAAQRKWRADKERERERETRKCFVCGKPGHIAKDCDKRCRQIGAIAL